jgi:hypothetical protein
MFKRMLRHTLFLLFSIQVFGSQWVFVKPITLEKVPGSIRVNMAKGEFEGLKVFLFEQDQSNQHEKIHSKLQASKMVTFVTSLRRQARELHQAEYGKYATTDQSQTPFLVYAGNELGGVGPAVASSYRILIEDGKIRSDSLLLLAPIQFRGETVTMEDFLSENYLAPLIAHEFFHGIMGDIYGERLIEMKARSTSRVGHRADRVTDEYLAFIEGVAEAMELATLEMYPAEASHKMISAQDWPEKKREFLRKIKRRRLVAANRNHLSLASDGRKKDGELDSAEDLFKTEGVIATLLFRLLFKSRVEEPFEKLLNVMIAHKPMTFIDFLRAFCDDFPQDRKFVIRQFLESTRYITVDSAAGDSYKRYYLAKKAYKQKRLSREEYNSVVQAWSEQRSAIYQRVLDGEIALDQTIGPVYGMSDDTQFYELDLNRSPVEELDDFFQEFFSDLLGEDEIQLHVARIMKLRESMNWISSMDSLPFSTEIESRIEEFHKYFIDEGESQVLKRLERLKNGIYAFTGDEDLTDLTSLFISHDRSEVTNE